MIYVLYGLEKYLINNYIEELKNKNKIEDFNIIIVYIKANLF